MQKTWPASKQSFWQNSLQSIMPISFFATTIFVDPRAYCKFEASLFIRLNSLILFYIFPKSQLLSKKKKYIISCSKDTQKNCHQSWWQLLKRSPWYPFSYDNHSLSSPMESVLEVTTIIWNLYVGVLARESDLLPYKHVLCGLIDASRGNLFTLCYCLQRVFWTTCIYCHYA